MMARCPAEVEVRAVHIAQGPSAVPRQERGNGNRGGWQENGSRYLLPVARLGRGRRAVEDGSFQKKPP